MPQRISKYAISPERAAAIRKAATETAQRREDAIREQRRQELRAALRKAQAQRQAI